MTACRARMAYWRPSSAALNIKSVRAGSGRKAGRTNSVRSGRSRGSCGMPPFRRSNRTSIRPKRNAGGTSSGGVQRSQSDECQSGSRRSQVSPSWATAAATRSSPPFHRAAISAHCSLEHCAAFLDCAGVLFVEPRRFCGKALGDPAESLGKGTVDFAEGPFAGGGHLRQPR